MGTINTLIRKTTQRQTILDFLYSHPGHFTPQEIHEQITRILPRISLGTVYRNLHALSYEHRITELVLPDQKTYFDGNKHEHDHFICDRCKSIFDVPAVRTNKCCFQKPIQKLSIGEIKNYTFLFSGMCQKCLSKKHAKK